MQIAAVLVYCQVPSLAAVRIPSTLLKPAALLLLGASTVFGCTVANALTFNWSWTPDSGSGNITGTISGLQDNTNAQKNGIVTVTSAPSAPPGGWGPWSYNSGYGFNVTGGQVTFYDAEYVGPGGRNSQALTFGNGVYTPYPSIYSASGNINFSDFSTPVNITFTPVAAAAVPGPLPILGLPAVLFYSRKLKARIKASRELSSNALV